MKKIDLLCCGGGWRTEEEHAKDHPLCAIGSSAAGRTLVVTRPVAPREVILQDVAIVDSACSSWLISRCFSLVTSSRDALRSL